MWKPVRGFENHYQVSDSGEVARLVGAQCTKPRVLKPSLDKRGYLRVKLSVLPVQAMCSVHKLVSEAFIGPAGDMTVNHKDCNKLNNRLDNLEYLTRLENTAHAVAHGRVSFSNATLSPEAVKDIRARYKPRTNSSTQLAAEYGITRRSICRLIAGKNWSHIS